MLELFYLHQTGWNELRPQAVLPTFQGEIQGCFNSTKRGYTMPVFTFEKISPPVRGGPLPPIAKKQRGVIVQILDRFVEARARRTRREEESTIARRQHQPPDK
jgi:hypothetical protein